MALKKATNEEQRNFLSFMISHPTLFVRVSNIYNYLNFDKNLRAAAKFLQEHVDKYSTIPTVEQVKAVANTQLELIEGIQTGHTEWFMEEFESFTKTNELERAIVESAELLNKGEFGPIEKLIKDAVQISLTRDLGIDYFHDPRERLLRLKNNNGQFPTGWLDLDSMIYGGFNRGELNIFCGGPGCVTGDTIIQIIEVPDL